MHVAVEVQHIDIAASSACCFIWFW